MDRVEVIKQSCPYCASAIALVVDTSMTGQRYIEDCQVCCRPIQVEVVAEGDAPVPADAWAGEAENGGAPEGARCRLRLYREDEVQ